MIFFNKSKMKTLKKKFHRFFFEQANLWKKNVSLKKKKICGVIEELWNVCKNYFFWKLSQKIERRILIYQFFWFFQKFKLDLTNQFVSFWSMLFGQIHVDKIVTRLCPVFLIAKQKHKNTKTKHEKYVIFFFKKKISFWFWVFFVKKIFFFI